MPDPLRHYTSSVEDSARWIGFPFRNGDIVISSRTKMGTTWVQMICALLIFQTPEPPDSLANLSPWPDWLIAPRGDVYDLLAAQDHRRFIKTHTPLDGVPADPRTTYIVPGRHPLDTAVSLYHHSANLNRDRMLKLSGQPPLGVNAQSRPPLHEWLLQWIDDDANPTQSLDSLPGVLWHLSDAWSRRGAQRVVLIHYDDLLNDLGGQMHHLAHRLHIVVPDQTWPALIQAATFAKMSARAESLVPDPSEILNDHGVFFRRGSSGAAAEILTRAELEHYYQRVSTLASDDLLDWLHHGSFPLGGVQTVESP